MGFIAELKRRNVIRMAGLYLVGAWLVVQVASTLLPMFGAPGWASRAVVVGLALLFVPAMLFSWVYELTPEGLKRESEVERGASVTQTTGQRIEHAMVVVLALALAFFAFDKFVMAPRERAAMQAANAREVALARAAAPAAGIPSIESDPSIAVLPFVNLSGDPAQQYFSDGVSEELLNVLSKVPKLRVIARTSSFSFRDGRATSDEIARKLHVAALLQGSVRTAGGKVRIAVQLVRARDGNQLWSDSYDRQVDDIFEVQEEIAAAVVDRLKLSLLGGAPAVRPVDPRVYPTLLRANNLMRSNDRAGRREALALYRQALAIVPDEPRLWSRLGLAYLTQAALSEMPASEGARLAKDALNRALAIDPKDAVTISRLAFLAETLENDRAGAAVLYQQALALDPRSDIVLNNAAAFLNALGRFDEALPLGARLIELDPTNPTVYANQALALYDAGRWDEALATVRATLALSPEYPSGHFTAGQVLLVGKRDPAAAMKEFEAEMDPLTRSAGLAIGWHALGRTAEAVDELARLAERQPDVAANAIAIAYASMGMRDEAFHWLDRAVANQDPGVVIMHIEPMFESLHDDPRWLPLLRRTRQAPEQLAEIRFSLP